MFSVNTYIDRRNVLARNVKSGVLVFPGNSYSPINFPANCYPFRQDSNFLYYFGLDIPAVAAIIDIDNGTEIIFADEQSIDDKVWSGELPAIADQAEKIGISDVRPMAAISDYLLNAAEGGRDVSFLPFYRAQQRLQASSWLKVDTDRIMQFISLDFIKAVANQRNIKTSEEIEQIELATDLTGYMQLAAMELTANGVFESEIVAEMAAVVNSYGSAYAFPPIFSVHGEILHNPFYRNQMFDGDMAVCDCGAESPLHYAGDLTRTIPVSGRFTDSQKEIYSIVLNAQEDAIDMVKPGVKFRDIHLHACEKLAYGLKCLGLMRGDHKEAVALGAHALFFQCGLGHMLGLDVHDMEALGEQHVGYGELTRSKQFGLKSLRLAQELQAGNVVTVEPGIYFIPQLIDMWQAEHKFDDFINYGAVEKYRDFGGIRIEDDILVTDSSWRLLGAAVPKTITQVEEACQG